MFVIGFAETSRQLVSRCQKKIWHLPAAQNYKTLAGCQNHLRLSLKGGLFFPVRRKNCQNVSPMKSDDALKTNNPPEEKFLRGIRNGKKIT